MQRFVRSSTQCTHSPHCGLKRVTTWSPGASDVTAEPTCLDDAGALVAEHRRGVPGRIDPRGRVEVGVADPAGDEANQHLVVLRVLEVELLDHQGLAELLQYRRAHLHLE